MTEGRFIYLLNAFEQASQADNPADHGYAEKRRALLEYVAKLETSIPSENTAWKPVSANDPTRCVAWVDESASHVGKIVNGQRYLTKLPEAPK
jgi:hypothetical protein